MVVVCGVQSGVVHLVPCGVVLEFLCVLKVWLWLCVCVCVCVFACLHSCLPACLIACFTFLLCLLGSAWLGLAWLGLLACFLAFLCFALLCFLGFALLYLLDLEWGMSRFPTIKRSPHLKGRKLVLFPLFFHQGPVVHPWPGSCHQSCLGLK